jgi:hypothetical protein
MILDKNFQLIYQNKKDFFSVIYSLLFPLKDIFN